MLKVQITSTNINFYGKNSSLSTVAQVLCVSEPIKRSEWCQYRMKAPPNSMTVAGIWDILNELPFYDQNQRPSVVFSCMANCFGTVASNEPHIPATEYINMKHSQNDNWQGKPECSKKIPLYCYFVHHKPHMDYTANEPRPLLQKDWDLTIWAMSNFTSWVAELSN
jgi:hypothetical protein